MTISGSFRGGLALQNTLYGAWTDQVYSVTSDGETVLFSTLNGTDTIFTARNNAATPNIAVVADAGPFIINTTAGAVQAYPDGDVGQPSCVGGHLGYMVFGYGTGDMLSTDLNSTNINTLNSARTESNPDGVLNIISYQGLMYVFGSKTVEVWGGVNTSGFPVSRSGFNITPGLIAPHAVSGWEAEFGNPPIWVGSDNTVRQFDGYNAAKISPPDLDRLIASVNHVDKDQINAISYVSGGHAFWQINGPTFSWVYNLNNGKWHERKSYLSTRSNFINSIAAFDRWLVGSTESSDLLEIVHDEPTEGGDPLIAQMESLPVTDFPNRVRVPRADFDFTVGVGVASGTDPIETDPTVLVEWSDDGGQSWRGPWWRKLGRQDITQKRVTVLNTGLSGPMGRKWRWSISDPVHVGFIGATMDAEVRNK